MQDEFSKLIEQIDRRRSEKIAKLLELLRDPDLASFAAALQNGKHLEKPRETFVAPPGFKNGNGIQDAVRRLSLPARFTADDVFELLQRDGFRFTAKRPRGSARDAISKLTRGKNPEFKVVEKGQGGQPNYYERISH